MGRLKVPLGVLSVTTRTMTSLPGCMSVITAVGQWSGVVLSSRNRTLTEAVTECRLSREAEKACSYLRGTKSSSGSFCVTADQWRTQEFCSGGVQQIQLRTDDRENGDLGVVAL